MNNMLNEKHVRCSMFVMLCMGVSSVSFAAEPIRTEKPKFTPVLKSNVSGKSLPLNQMIIKRNPVVKKGLTPKKLNSNTAHRPVVKHQTKIVPLAASPKRRVPPKSAIPPLGNRKYRGTEATTKINAKTVTEKVVEDVELKGITLEDRVVEDVEEKGIMLEDFELKGIALED